MRKMVVIIVLVLGGLLFLSNRGGERGKSGAEICAEAYPEEVMSAIPMGDNVRCLFGDGLVKLVPRGVE